MAQRIPSLDELDRFTETIPRHEYDKAFDDLYERVRPMPWRVDAFKMLVGEYFLFEHVMECGLTPAQAMAADDPDLRAWSGSRYVRVVADRPFEGDVAFMRDVDTGEVYEVRGDEITSRPHWARGSLGCRLCQIDGVCTVVGWGNLHDNAETTEAYDGERASFARDLNRVIGDGGWEGTVSSVTHHVA